MIKVDLDACVSTLSFAEKQQVEILRLLYQESKLMIFDEVTSLLSVDENVQVHDILRALTKEGKYVLFISHDLPEIKVVADRVCVLKEGSVQNIVKNKDLSAAELAKEVIGDISNLLTSSF